MWHIASVTPSHRLDTSLTTNSNLAIWFRRVQDFAKIRLVHELVCVIARVSVYLILVPRVWAYSAAVSAWSAEINRDAHNSADTIRSLIYDETYRNQTADQIGNCHGSDI